MMYACDHEQRMRGIMTEAVRSDIQEVASMFAGPQRPEPDCLFAMFRDKSREDDSRMDAIQYIDSSFALDQLDQWDRWDKQIDVKEYAKGYLLGKTCGDLTMQGWFYERIMHRWFLRAISETRPSPINGIQEVCYSSSGEREDLSQLTKAGVYWIPSKHTFPVISAAVVHKRTLHAFL
jgi:hypothetical protein